MAEEIDPFHVLNLPEEDVPQAAIEKVRARHLCNIFSVPRASIRKYSCTTHYTNSHRAVYNFTTAVCCASETAELHGSLLLSSEVASHNYASTRASNEHISGVQAFRVLALKYHPDKNPDPSAHEVFQRIQLAKEMLLDPETKAALLRVKRYGLPPFSYAKPLQRVRSRIHFIELRSCCLTPSGACVRTASHVYHWSPRFAAKSYTAHRTGICTDISKSEGACYVLGDPNAGLKKPQCKLTHFPQHYCIATFHCVQKLYEDLVRVFITTYNNHLACELRRIPHSRFQPINSP